MRCKFVIYFNLKIEMKCHMWEMFLYTQNDGKRRKDTCFKVLTLRVKHKFYFYMFNSPQENSHRIITILIFDVK